MAAKDDKITVPVVPTASVFMGPAVAEQAPLLLPDAAELLVTGITADQRRRYGIREDLLKSARENFDDILGTTETRYSRDLALLQTSLNAYLKEEPGVNTCAIYLDPAKFDAAMALGFAETSAIGRVLARQGLLLDPDDLNDGAKLGVIADQTLSKYESRFGINIYTLDPAANPNVGSATPAHVIIPSADYAVPYPVPGLSRAEDRDFTNLHEGWHAKNDRYRLTSDVSQETYKKIAKFDAAVLADDNETEARSVFVIRHRGEVLSDVGALGDMVRGGKDPSIIDKVRAWRRADPDDFRHMSVQALDGLKAEIDKMGVEKFRKLPNRAAKDLYTDIVEDYGIDERGLRAAAVYSLNEGNSAIIGDLEASAKIDPAIAKGLAFFDLVGDRAQRAAAADDTLTPAELSVKDQLAKWDALQALQDRAFKDGGRITPVTMVKAYTALSDDLRAEMDAEPDNNLIDQKMGKLHATFIDTVPQIDYLEANRRFGVDIVAQEPVLDKYKPEAKTATRPAGPKAGG
ncbi:MAG: hypothetical protein ACAH80_01020 [Alphaproteobacteria bacterium]